MGNRRYEAQIDYYTNYIKGRNDWEFVSVYTDEGITGTSTKHREGFKRMIRDFTEQVSRIGNNLNQYAKVANTTGSIYAQDIAYLREQFAVLCDMEGKILAKLAAIR